MTSRVFIALAVLALAGCSPKPPPALPVVSSAAIRAELAGTGAFLTFDDKQYSPLGHAWLEAALARHLAATWHDRAYAPEAKDCDDFTDFLVSSVRHEFAESAAPASGGALVGRYTVWMPGAGTDRLGAWHRVALARTDRGWFVADPQALIPRPWRIPLVPLAAYGRPAHSAAF